METMDLQAHIGYWLRLVSNRVSGDFRRALQQRDVSVAEWVALNLILATAQATPAALATEMGMTRGAVSKVLDKLEGRQWISRSHSDRDSRVRLLSITPQGRRALPELARLADANDRRFFGALERAEQATLRRLLLKLATVHRITQAPVD